MLPHVSVKVFRHQVPDNIPPVAQESESRFRTVDYVAEQSRDPFPQRIVCTGFEFGFHIFCPCLGLAFPAVEQEAVEESVCKRPSFSSQPSDISVELRIGAGSRELVAFPSCPFFRSRPVLHPRIHMADPEYGPFPGRRFPVQDLPVEPVCKIQYSVFVDIGFRRMYVAVSFPFYAPQSPACFRFPVVFPCR